MNKKQSTERMFRVTFDVGERSLGTLVADLKSHGRVVSNLDIGVVHVVDSDKNLKKGTVAEAILYVLGTRKAISRKDLSEEVAARGFHKASIDQQLTKMVNAKTFKQTGTRSSLVLHRVGA